MPECWRLMAARPRVVLLNLPQAIVEPAGEELRVAGDGRRLPFRDGSFDVVFSNSVIEHLGGRSSQESFARTGAGGPRRFPFFALAAAAAMVAAAPLGAQGNRVSGSIDSSQMATLAGHVPPQARAEFDQERFLAEMKPVAISGEPQ